MIKKVIDEFAPSDYEINIFRYINNSWHFSSMKKSANATYFLHPDKNSGIAAEAVACLWLKKIMRIAFVLPLYLPSKLSGSAIFVQKIAEKFATLGNDVHIYTSNVAESKFWYIPASRKKLLEKYQLINGVKIHRLPCVWCLSSFYFILNSLFKKVFPNKRFYFLEIMSFGPIFYNLRSKLKQEKFDVVHFSPVPFAFNLQLTKKSISFCKKLIATPFVHTELDIYSNPYIYSLLKKCSLIHVISNYEKNFLIKRIGRDKNFFVESLFVTKADFPKKQELKINNIKVIKNFNLNKKKIILFAGNKGRWKGALDLLEIVNTLYKTNDQLLLIAIGNSTKEWTNAIKRIDKRCLLDLPYQSGIDKFSFFSLCNVFAMPSISESFGLVYLEALYYNKPIIAANIPAVRSFLGRNANYVPYGNKKYLELSVKKYISNEKVSKVSTPLDKFIFEKKYLSYVKAFKV